MQSRNKQQMPANADPEPKEGHFIIGGNAHLKIGKACIYRKHTKHEKDAVESVFRLFEIDNHT